MPATSKANDPPAVSIIVPARNEEVSLKICMDSLVAQAGVAFEIIVVDDHSTDRTREIASAFSNRPGHPCVRVIEAGPLPAGWTGKNNAVVAGTKIARGEWLLFTDADTIHLPGSLARSIEEGKRHHAALLSYSPEQIVKGFWEKAVMPVVFAELAATFRPAEVSNPNSPAAAANGQYLLITRETYDAVGRHAAVAGNFLEDLAMARVVKQSGRKILFRFGGDAVRTRMYRGFAQLREGWTRSLLILFPSPVRLAVLRALEFVLIAASFTISLAAGLRGHWQPAVVSGALGAILYGFFLIRIRRAHFSWDATILALFGLPLFSYFLLRSKLFHERGRVSWKGRTYPGDGPPATAAQEADRTQEQHGLSHAKS